MLAGVQGAQWAIRGWGVVSGPPSSSDQPPQQQSSRCCGQRVWRVWYTRESGISWDPRIYPWLTESELISRFLMADENPLILLREIIQIQFLLSIYTCKVHIVKAVDFPIVMYGCESWTVKKAEHQRIDAFKLWCWRRLLRVLWTARKSSLNIHWKD